MDGLLDGELEAEWNGVRGGTSRSVVEQAGSRVGRNVALRDEPGVPAPGGDKGRMCWVWVTMPSTPSPLAGDMVCVGAGGGLYAPSQPTVERIGG